MAFYLFPKTMYKRYRCIVGSNPILEQSNNLYQLVLSQYLGLGAILQFIPTTNAFKIRKQFSNELNEAISRVYNNDEFMFKDGVIKETDIYGLKKKAILASLGSYFSLAPLFNLLNNICTGFNVNGVVQNQKISFTEIAWKFPVLRDFSEFNAKAFKKSLGNLSHSLFNPLRLIEDFLNFLHFSVLRVLDSGSNSGQNSSMPRMLIKGVVSLVFGLIKAPIIIAKHALDIVLMGIIKSLLFDSIVHIFKSVQSAWVHRKEKTMFATIDDFRDLRVFKRTAQEKPDIVYSAQPNNVNTWQDKRDYVGAHKMRVFEMSMNEEADTQYNTDRLIARRAPIEKINKMSALLERLGAFKNVSSRNEAVAEAKVILASQG